MLLVSGVGGAADFAELARIAPASTRHLAGRVTLGRAAASTHGNAAETADWARGNGDPLADRRDRRLPHAPRAGRTGAHAAGAWRCIPPRCCRRRCATATPDTVLRLLAGEYTKWLAAEAGLTALDARRWSERDGAGGG